MAGLAFYKKEDYSSFLDPRDNYAAKAVPFEIRRDPLTGETSRILAFRRKYPQLSVPGEILKRSKEICPFCPDKISALTPAFPPEIAPEGRPRRGKAVLIPNAFPYARHSGVVVICEEHFLYPDELSVQMLTDAFLLACEGISRISGAHPSAIFPSINWNYLPEAGAGLFHPHLQIIVEDTPTSSHSNVLKGIGKYKEKTGAFYWEELLSEEKMLGERFIGKKGAVEFIAAFSPRGIFGEIDIVFKGRWGIDEITEREWLYFSEGLSMLFSYLRNESPSFNLSIFSGGTSDAESWVYGRLCPRMSIPPWNISDINYFEKLHGEVVCMISPEELAGGLRAIFGKANPD